jgi:hypothetical protein
MITAAAIGAVILAWVFYQQAKFLQAQIAELRRVMDYQFDGLRYEIKQVNDILKFVEPQLHMGSINMYVAARNTDLKSMQDVIGAVESGRHQSAIVPFSILRTTKSVNSTAA